MKAEVEVTVETDFPRHHTGNALADEIRDKVFGIIQSEGAYDVIVMTVTGVDE